jgi:hypothetical protein
MSFMIIPRKTLVLAPPLAESFDKTIDVSHLQKPQPPQCIGHVSPRDIEFFECGTLSHSVEIDETGTFMFPDVVKPFAKILQTGLDYFFSMASDPQSIKCRMLVTDSYNITRGEYARPRYPDEFLHIDQSHRDVCGERDHPSFVSDSWYSVISWAGALPTEFGHNCISYSADDTKQNVLTKIVTTSPKEVETFQPGDIVFYTGATPHRIARNLDRDVVFRQWMAMILYRPAIKGP